MKIAIHDNNSHFSKGWIDYCKKTKIDFKLVDCYNTNIIETISDCDILMWHHNHQSAQDIKFAKQLLYSVELSGKVIYPDFKTNWHFDDKLGQKYLLEAIGAPLVKSYVFYSRQAAIEWAKESIFPKVFKLRNGSGSDNVSLIKNQKDAIRYINKAFSSGFSQYNAWKSLKERWRKYKIRKTRIKEVFDGLARFIIPIKYIKILGRDRGYIYFQDFIPDNTHDIRVTYVDNKCFALRRKVRAGDFRASGGGMIEYDMSKIPLKALEIAFKVANRLKVQSLAFDFVINNEEPLIIEISYAFGYDEDQYNHGYWNQDLDYFSGTFNPYGWMVDNVIRTTNENKNKCFH